MSKKQLDVGMSLKYASDWGVEEGLREILQNWLDAEGFKNGFVRYDEDSGQAIIKDTSGGIELRHLLMGISEKSSSAIGKFGEGLKLALLVFAREGRKVLVKSRNRWIEPVIDFSEEYEENVLRFAVDETASDIEGTEVRVKCFKKELENAKKNFSYFETFKMREVEEIEGVGTVYKPGGKIWINGALVKELDAANFSYNLTGAEAKEAVGRDRDIVDLFKVRDIFRDCVRYSQGELLKQYLLLIKEDKDCWETRIDSYRYMVKNYNLWEEAMREVFGDLDKVVYTSSNAKADSEAEYRGYQVVKNHNAISFLQALEIPSAQEVLEKEIKFKKVETPSPEIQENLKFAKEALDFIDYSSLVEIHIVRDIEAVPGMEAFSAWTRDYKIFIPEETAEDKLGLLENLIHEIGHIESHAEDCSPVFEDWLGTMAARAALRLKEVKDEKEVM